MTLCGCSPGSFEREKKMGKPERLEVICEKKLLTDIFKVYYQNKGCSLDPNYEKCLDCEGSDVTCVGYIANEVFYKGRKRR